MYAVGAGFVPIFIPVLHGVHMCGQWDFIF